MNKKGQLLGQAFVFILAGLVFIIILGYGYKAVTYLLERQEEVVILNFRTDLETAIQQVKREFQTVRQVTLSLPVKYQGVCFFNYETCNEITAPRLFMQDSAINVQWAKEACAAGSGNVLIVPRSAELDVPSIEIKERQGYVCVANNNGINLRLEGTGKSAIISEWETE